MLGNASFGWRRTRKTGIPSRVGSQLRVCYFHLIVSETDIRNLQESSLQSTYDLAVAAGGDPRVMLINSPSNPTGQAFSRDTIETITRFCLKNGITLISDEIYSDICFDGSSDNVSPCDSGRFDVGQMILTGGLSKVSLCFTQFS